MNITETILTTVLITLILPVVFSLFWFFKLRSEKDISSDEVIRTRPPQMLSGFFLGFGLIVLLGGIGMIVYSCITDSENTTFGTVVMMSVFVALFSAIGFFAYAYYRFNYVVADTNGILVYRLFRKKRYYTYSEIGSFQDTTNLGMLGGLKGYDKNNSQIFAIEAVHIGVSAVAERLREKGILEIFKR